MSQERKGSYEVSIDGQPRLVRIRRLDTKGKDPVYEVHVGDDPPIRVEALHAEPGVLSLMLGGRSIDAGLLATDEGWVVDILGVPHEVSVIDPRKKALRTVGGGGHASVRTQMPGRVVRILVEPGQQVKKGDPVIVVEAMKMENELKAPQDATVEKILVQPGALVEARAILVELS